MEEIVGTLVSVNVGLPEDVPWEGRTVHTGIWKSSVDGPQRVRRLNIDGDGQGDLNGHGGEQRAVLVYQLDSYDHWSRHLGRDDLVHGNFGENFTVDGMPDDQVCIGDRYRVGTAVFEVTQPRVTCFRVGMRLGVPEMASLLVGHRRPGFYLRVITEGVVEAGDEIERLSVGAGAVSVTEADGLLYLPGPRDPARLRAALDNPALSPGWQGSFRDLLAARPVARPGWAGFRPLLVTRVRRESEDTVSFYLAPADGSALPVALPGQYLTVRVPDGSVRSYSLSLGSSGYRITVKHESGGDVSGYLHSQVAEGDSLEVAAPRGEFTLADASSTVALISAGIGVTPVLAMLHALADTGAHRGVWWLHVTRTVRSQVFADEVSALLDRIPGAHERIFLTAHESGDPLPPHAEIGRPTAQRLAELGLPADTDAYICGPSGFMGAVSGALVAAGLPASRVHTELFGTLAAVNPGVVGSRQARPHPPATQGSGPEITFARSGLTVRWSEEYASLLELAEACDVPVRWSCRTGVCHTCVTGLLAGEIRYRVDPLEPPAVGDALICCSVPLNEGLVLDI
ncbi:MOSC and FAD-binding oxidoreductase domain-containing protein [Herbidospora mongoliensis]|uniref:MOSC and FAD-binding oxidoreductase domain-containing protein n=1 Tax=Herbidospora mongoliensis TaxID=688067 RepID=UPI00082B5288|nr:MOSC and FAD-binding oxidoreductase domain-containing protein [Herbidospora mongoliensis]